MYLGFTRQEPEEGEAMGAADGRNGRVAGDGTQRAVEGVARVAVDEAATRKLAPWKATSKALQRNASSGSH